MIKKKFRLCFILISPFLISSCSLAGSWVYERIDSYIADYFIEFADFDQRQIQEIEKTSKDFHDWFSNTELPEIRTLLLDLKKIDTNSPKSTISSTYRMGELIFIRANRFFEEPIIQFTKNMTDSQISQMEEHFGELRREREEEREEESRDFKQRLLENYESGFKRVGIGLNQEQLSLIDLKLNEYIEVRDEWSNLQEDWINQFINLVRQNKQDGYESKLSNYLRSIQDLGGPEFRKKVDQNERLSLEIIEVIFRSLNEKQLKSFRRNIDIYLKSINRILSNRGINTEAIG